MKKITLIWAALFALALTGCNKSSDPQEGNQNVPGVAGRNLVSKMTCKIDRVEEEEDPYDGDRYKETFKAEATLKFSYKDGLLTQLAADGGFEAVYEDWYEGDYTKEEEKVEGSANMDFTYNGAAVTKAAFSATGTSTDGSGATVSGTYNFKTNSANALVSGEARVNLVNDWYTETFQCGYDNDNQLLYLEYNESGDRTNFEWKDGNLSKIGWSWSKSDKAGSRNKWPFLGKSRRQGKDINWSSYELKYSEKENKTNVDFAYITFLFYYGMEGMAEGFGMPGFMGKESQNLPSAVYYYDEYDEEKELCAKFDYKFNGDGLVKSVTVKECYYDYEEEKEVEETLFTVNFNY